MSKRRIRRPASVMITPLDLSRAERTGRRTFRKQILPLTTINYRGRKITFDRQFLQSVKDAFDKRAFDQVPLVLANAANEHHMDPERFTGDVKDLELTDHGLDAIIETTRRGARVIADNPKVGVSVRVKSNYERADGEFFPHALNHVLVTMDPKVTGMTPWQTVDLSTEGTTEVVDLTAAHYKEGTTMAKTKTAKGGQPQSSVVSIPLGNGKTQDLDLANLSDEEFASLLDLAAGDAADDDEDDENVIDVTDDLDDDDDDDEDEDEDDDDDDSDDEDDDEEAPTTLSNPFKKGKGKVKGKAAESDADEEEDGGKPGLTKGKAGKVPPQFIKNSRAKGRRKGSPAEKRLVSLSNKIAKAEWDRTRSAYIKAGVPPHLLDLAEPVLSTGDDTTLDLSNTDKSLDVAGILRDMLDASKGYIEQKPEVGHQIDLSEVPQSEAEALAKAWDAEYGDVSITI